MTTALEGEEVSASRPGRFLPPGKTQYPLYRRPPTEIRSLDRPARSQSIYLLSYRAHKYINNTKLKALNNLQQHYPMASPSLKASMSNVSFPWCHLMCHAVHMPCVPIELYTINIQLRNMFPFKAVTSRRQNVRRLWGSTDRAINCSMSTAGLALVLYIPAISCVHSRDIEQ
jgi:hypothetical protein